MQHKIAWGWLNPEAVAKELKKYYISDSRDGTEGGLSEFWIWIGLKVMSEDTKNDKEVEGGRVTVVELIKGPDMQNLKSCTNKAWENRLT